MGSGQQVVTAADGTGDYNTIWAVKEAEQLEGTAPCRTGQAVKCGDRIRLEHNLTGRNLHSHAGVQAPLSGNQEVSGYGDGGDGDQNDDWEVECNKNYAYGNVSEVGDVVKGSTVFHLKHVSTGQYLTAQNGYQFNH